MSNPQSIVYVSGQTVVVASGAHVITNSDVNSGLYVTISGQGVQIQSGLYVVTDATLTVDGSTYPLFSGYSTTASYAYSGTQFLTDEKATIMLNCTEERSGVLYTVRGHVISGITAYSIHSGAIYSGDIVVQTLSDPYDYIEVGIVGEQSDQSGRVTVFMATR